VVISFDDGNEDIYTNAILEIKNILACLSKGEPFSGEILSVHELEYLIENQNEDILILADRATPDIYLYAHSANVCIFSLLLGQAMKFDASTLADLGMCAFLHDLGMTKNLSIALKNGKLSPAEQNQIRKHSFQGQEMIDQLKDLPVNTRSILSEVIVQIHERRNGSGYPQALKENAIHQYARIIAIADMYEALTHPRTYRDRFLPHEALKMMITEVEALFDADILKAFIDRLSLYPPGSYLRLNTGEIARVTGINRCLPTRPKVKVVIDENNRRATEPKIIDLAAAPTLFIKDAVDETKLNLPEKKLAIELKAIRWWVKGL
jgi:HD-GYP domain-containing protein (c-di-GMP phosphodiesterase class II)